MGDKYLSNVIDYERDMKGRNFIAIYSGVGSGKNRFIDSFYKEDPEISNPQMTVLLITSRRAKVDELLDGNEFAKGKIGRWGNLHDVKKETESEEEFRKKYKKNLRIIERGNQKHFVYQQSVVCTNAFIEKYLQYVYDPRDITTHLWELFDMIVVDEAHSLILDASYQSAPYYVHDLIKEYLLRCKQGEEDYHLIPMCKHLVIMTGTPEHLGELDVYTESNNLHIIDKREECINVVPRNIHFIKKDDVEKQLEEQLDMGERGIYFSQSISKLQEYYAKISDVYKPVIAYSFSDEDKRNKLPKEVKKKMETSEESIKKKGLLPENIQLLLSTERNKEGINIYDKDISNLYVESKHLGDIVQMAGRVRAGVENMYVVLYGGRKENEENPYETLFALNKLVGHGENKNILNDYWQELCLKHESDLFKNRNAGKTVHQEKWSSDFVDYVHETFPYIRYSYFNNCFEFYINRWSGNWDYDVAGYDRRQALAQKTITQMFEQCFPASIVHPCTISINKKKEVDVWRVEKAKKYISDTLIIGEKYSENQRQQFIVELNDILGTEYTHIKTIFKHMDLNYTMERVTKTGKINKKKITDKDKKDILFTDEVLSV